MNNTQKIPTEHTSPLSVCEFLECVNTSLTSQYGRVQGEITSISGNYQKAIYFTIKDGLQEALLNCIIWRSDYNKNGVDIKVGDEIIITGVPEVYLPRGSFSLKTKTIEYAGEGALKRSYEELKAKLQSEGLFDSDRKRELPKYPQKIGVITSKIGVVMQDFTSNLGRYGFKIKMVDSRVEGKDSIHEILASIKRFEKEDVEILVIMRGGGSWESLQPFNTESVVRAIANFKCPVVTGIGHDTDITLVQLAADVGESTPTAAAEALNESWDTLLSSIDFMETKTIRKFEHQLSSLSSLVSNNSTAIFRRYERLLVNTKNYLNDGSSKIFSHFSKLQHKFVLARSAFQRSVGIMKSNTLIKRKFLSEIPYRLVRFSRNLISSARNETAECQHLILSRQIKFLIDTRVHLKSLEKNVQLVSPENNLKKGYSLAYTDGKLIRSIENTALGGIIETYLIDGKITSKINKII